MTTEEEDRIVHRVISAIEKKYFLVEKTFYLEDATTDSKRAREVAFIENVVQEVCKYYGITKEQLLNGGRFQFNEFVSLSEMRYIVVGLCRSLPERPITLQAIANALDRESHLFALRAGDRCKSILSDNYKKEFVMDYRAIEKAVNESLRL